MRSIIGNINADGKNITIISSKYNQKIVDMLYNGAIDAYCYNGGNINNIVKIEVPGAFEIPAVVNQVLKNIKTDAILTLGSVIKGATPHFDYVSGESSKGIAKFGQLSDIPIIFGILTTNNINEALERASTKAGNKGWELMEATLQSISIYNQIKNN